MSAEKNLSQLQFKPGVYFHGSKAQLQPGDLVEAGHVGGVGVHSTGQHNYFTANPYLANRAARGAHQRGPATVYSVDPTGPYGIDPGSGEFRSEHPLRVRNAYPAVNDPATIRNFARKPAPRAVHEADERFVPRDKDPSYRTDLDRIERKWSGR